MIIRDHDVLMMPFFGNMLCVYFKTVWALGKIAALPWHSVNDQDSVCQKARI